MIAVKKVNSGTDKKVLILDNTITQKCKYVVPVINPTKSYITTYEDIEQTTDEGGNNLIGGDYVNGEAENR